ncbi:prepilin-type N-terminal cleavage/methylation domain-containing protein [Kiritimatiellota bacterium B12222]|nr:prepilin-type N-terminal cleavage/methylation domain-containing protein [Kiritimatiellota bacterium B12222]
MKKFNTISRKSGFTLAEILLAMMVFAIAITTILALLSRTLEQTDSVLVKDEAINLSSAVDNFMSEIPFTTAYQAVVNQPNSHLFAYQYRAEVNGSGVLVPYPTVQPGDQVGVDYEVVTGVRWPGDVAELAAEVAALDGRLFKVYLEVSEANPLGNTGLDSDPNTVSGSPAVLSYDSAVLVVFAEMYAVPSTEFPLVRTEVTPDFSFNFAVSR